MTSLEKVFRSWPGPSSQNRKDASFALNFMYRQLPKTATCRARYHDGAVLAEQSTGETPSPNNVSYSTWGAVILLPLLLETRQLRHWFDPVHEPSPSGPNQSRVYAISVNY